MVERRAVNPVSLSGVMVRAHPWEPLRKTFGMWPSPAKALALGARHRGFKSLHPDHYVTFSGSYHVMGLRMVVANPLVVSEAT